MYRFLVHVALLSFSGWIGAVEPDPNYPFSSKWEPFYSECMAKYYAQMINPMKMTYAENFTVEEQKELEWLVNAAEMFSATFCSCLCNQADVAFSEAEQDIAPNQIRSLAQHYRYEVQYDDPVVSALFGSAVLPCLDLKIEDMDYIELPPTSATE